MYREDDYDEVRNAISYFWEESEDMRRRYFNELTEFCGDTQSRVVLEFLAECEELCNNHIGQLWTKELDEWTYDRTSFVYTMRHFMCGEDAEYDAKVEQQRIEAILEDYRRLDNASQFSELTGVYTEDMHTELTQMLNSYVDATSDEYHRLRSKAEWLSEEGVMIAEGFIGLVETVLKVLVVVTEDMANILRSKEEYINQLPTDQQQELQEYSISFNPQTGYAEIQMKGVTDSLPIKGGTPLETARAIVDKLLSMERDYLETSNIKRELERQFDAII